jgi:hypothetical protein
MIDSPAEPVPAVRQERAPDPSGPLPPPLLTDLAPVAGSFHARQVVDQAITPNDFPRLISLVRALAPDTGSARQLGDGLQWEHDSGLSSLSLTINPEPSGTVIRADLRTDGERVTYALVVGVATILATLGTLASHWSALGIIGVAITTLVAGGGIARQLLRYTGRRRAAALQALVAKIAAGLRGDLT